MTIRTTWMMTRVPQWLSQVLELVKGFFNLQIFSQKMKISPKATPHSRWNFGRTAPFVGVTSISETICVAQGQNIINLLLCSSQTEFLFQCYSQTEHLYTIIGYFINLPINIDIWCKHLAAFHIFEFSIFSRGKRKKVWKVLRNCLVSMGQGGQNNMIVSFG